MDTYNYVIQAQEWNQIDRDLYNTYVVLETPSMTELDIQIDTFTLVYI